MAKREGIVRDMPLIQINIPVELKASVDAVAKQSYRSNMDYVRSLLRTDTTRRKAWGERYAIIDSLLNRLEPDDIEYALFAARK